VIDLLSNYQIQLLTLCDFATHLHLHFFFGVKKMKIKIAKKKGVKSVEVLHVADVVDVVDLQVDVLIDKNKTNIKNKTKGNKKEKFIQVKVKKTKVKKTVRGDKKSGTFRAPDPIGIYIDSSVLPTFQPA
jgi:hypothetical protein